MGQFLHEVSLDLYSMESGDVYFRWQPFREEEEVKERDAKEYPEIASEGAEETGEGAHEVLLSPV